MKREFTMVKDHPINVLLIDDHPVVHTGYRRLFESTSDIQVIADANDGETGCVLYALYHPDVVIVDLNMPGIGGLETIRRIKMRNPDAHILVFSVYTNEVMARRALEMGATGYLSKQGDVEQLLKAVRQVKQGRPYIDAELIPNMLTDKMHGDIPKNPLEILSKREFQLFKLLAEGNSIIQIAEMISISPKTVGVHHANIMRKLNLQNTAQLVRMAISCDVIQT